MRVKTAARLRPFRDLETSSESLSHISVGAGVHAGGLPQRMGCFPENRHFSADRWAVEDCALDSDSECSHVVACLTKGVS